MIEATLLKKEELCSVEVFIESKKETVKVFCPSLRISHTCKILGSRVWITASAEKNSYFSYNLELIEIDDGHLVDLNSYRTINLLLEALEIDRIKEFTNYQIYDLKNALADLVLSNKNKLCYINVYGCTNNDELKNGFFPDHTTVDGCSQINALIDCVKNGHRAVLFIAVQNSAINRLLLAKHIDSKFSSALKNAVQCGVEIIAYKSIISPEQINLGSICPVVLDNKLLMD